VDHAKNFVALFERLHQLGINLCWLEKLLAQSASKLFIIPIEILPGFFRVVVADAKNRPDQTEAVGVNPGRRRTVDVHTGPNPAAIDDIELRTGKTHRESGHVIVAGFIHTGHLGCFSTHEGHLG